MPVIKTMSDNQDYLQYSSSRLQQMNWSYPWNGSIIDNSQSYFSKASRDSNTRWELHATGDADLNGRKYVKIPAGTKITDQMKKDLNLL